MALLDLSCEGDKDGLGYFGGDILEEGSRKV